MQMERNKGKYSFQQTEGFSSQLVIFKLQVTAGIFRN